MNSTNSTEKQYRNLEPGEIIQAGDEVWKYGEGPWCKIVRIGATVNSGHHAIRRPIPPTPEPVKAREFVIWVKDNDYTVPNRRGDQLPERSKIVGWAEITVREVIPEPPPFDWPALWQMLPPWIGWVAMDEDGEWFGFLTLPYACGEWVTKVNDGACIIPPAYAPPRADDWRLSLTERPKP